MLHHLTLGRNKPDGGYVTDLDWQMYCQEVLDSNFDGYTITDAVGTWQSDLEDTKIVSIELCSILVCLMMYEILFVMAVQ